MEATRAVEQVDVVVVGMGPGGEFAANRLARGGLDVVAVEEHLVGGECPFYGCVPSKLMVRAADAVGEGRRAAALAHAELGPPSWAPVAGRIRRSTRDWQDAHQVARLEESGGRLVRGRGRLAGVREVEVGELTLRARLGVVLATGTAPALPAIDGLADTPYWTNRDVVKVVEPPQSLAVLGAGPIGCELAQVFARFGTEVTLVEAADRILAVEEPESSDLLTDALTADGVRVRAGAAVDRVAFADGRFSLTMGEADLRVERLLVATGRQPNLPDLGLGSVGVGGDVKAVDVDGLLRVRDEQGEVVEGLWAVGDIVGRGAFTHVAKYQAAIVVRQLLGKDTAEADYRAVPRVTFTDPEVASVGLSEAAAREAGRDVRVGVVRLAESSRGDLHGPGGDGLIKLVAEGDHLVGATSMGPAGGEVLGMLTTAIHARVPISTLESMIYPYPTFHGAVRQALSRLR